MLTWLLLSWVVFIVGMASTIIADPVLADEFGWGSLGYGLITSCWGAGTIVGAWLGRNIHEDREAVWLVGGSAMIAFTGFAVFLSPWFWLVLVWVACSVSPTVRHRSPSRTSCSDGRPTSCAAA